MRDFKQIEVEDAQLFGAPLSSENPLQQCLKARISELQESLSQLTLIARQDFLLILTSSLGTPKMIHVLQCHPSDKHPDLEIYDTTLRQGLEKILNVSLNDMQWTQASLLYCIVLYSSIYIAPLNSLRQTEALLVQLAPRKETSFKK